MGLASEVFGSHPPRPGRLFGKVEQLSSLARGRFGLSRHIPAQEVGVEGVAIEALDPPLPPVARIFNGQDAVSRADLIFAARSQLALADLPDQFDAVNWTGPFPIKAAKSPNIYTLHDLIPLQYPFFVEGKLGRSARLHAAIAQEADHIFTVSETSKRHIVDMLDVAPDRVSVTYQPVPSLPEMAQSDAERLVETIYGAEPGKYALFLGAIEPKKNLKRLIEAFAISGVDMPLLLAGPLGWMYDDDLSLINRISSPNMSIRLLGFLPRRHVVALMRCARIFVFPSIYEGFGLPVLEAMQIGTPVLTSRVGPLQEVAGEAAVLVDPMEVDEIANGIRKLDGDLDLREEFSRRGPAQAAKFSEEAYAENLAEAYAKVGVTLSKPVPANPNKDGAASE